MRLVLPDVSFDFSVRCEHWFCFPKRDDILVGICCFPEKMRMRRKAVVMTFHIKERFFDKSTEHIEIPALMTDLEDIFLLLCFGAFFN
jgi:hypothetical protein